LSLNRSSPFLSLAARRTVAFFAKRARASHPWRDLITTGELLEGVEAYPALRIGSEEGLDVVLHRALQRRVGGASPAVNNRRASLWLDGHVRIPDRFDML
jgi:hypothetical protein